MYMYCCTMLINKKSVKILIMNSLTKKKEHKILPFFNLEILCRTASFISSFSAYEYPHQCMCNEIAHAYIGQDFLKQN